MKKAVIYLVVLLSFNLNGQEISPYDDFSIVDLMDGDLVIGDIDNDNDNDIIVTGDMAATPQNESGVCIVYKNDGAGNFSAYGESYMNCFNSTVDLGDVDNDGDLDLFVTGLIPNSGNYKLAKLFKNNGFGVFQEYGSQPFFPVMFGDSKFFDVDNDGDLDLIYTGFENNGDYRMKLYINDGLGNFIDSGMSLPGLAWASMDLADFDNDGDVDVLVNGQYNNGGLGNRTFLLENQNGVLVEFNEAFAPCSGSARFIDMEGDGDADVVVNGIPGNSSVYISKFFENNGGVFQDVGSRGIDTLIENMMEISDIDNDGDLDVFLTGRTETSFHEAKALLYLNNGFGNFSLDQGFLSQGLRDGAAGFGRFDANCSPDLIYFGFNENCAKQTYVMLNNNDWQECDSIAIVQPDNEDEDEYENHGDFEYTWVGNVFYTELHFESSWRVRSVEIVDCLGRLVYSKGYNQKVIDLDISQLSNGYYFVTFNSFGNIIRKRILKLNPY